MAERKALVVSCGLSWLATAMISNLTPAAFFLLKNSSAMNWKLWSWLVPVAAIRPDNGSIQAIFTVWPFCAEAPQALAKMIKAATALMARCIGCLLVTKPRSLAGCHGARIRVYPCSFPPLGAAQTPGPGLGAHWGAFAFGDGMSAFGRPRGAHGRFIWHEVGVLAT